MNEVISSPWRREDLWMDPFAFPAETKGRFAMLVLLALSLCWSLGLILFGPGYLRLLVEQVAWQVEDSDIGGLQQQSKLGKPSEGGKIDLRKASESSFPVLALGLLHSSAPVFFFVMSSIFIFLLHPRRIRRKYRSKPIDQQEAPKLVAQVREDAIRCGVPPPRLEWKPGFLDGLIFGRRGKEVLVLSGEPRFLEMSWNALNRAVVHHELGHVVNGDIQTREMVRAVWLSLVITVPVTLLAKGFGLMWSGHSPFFLSADRIFSGALYLGLLLAGVWLIWAGLIRMREYYADWRVQTWGMGDALRRRLKVPAAALFRRRPVLVKIFRGRLTSAVLHKSLAAFWSEHFRLHPGNPMRIETLNRPRRLFSVSMELALLSGLLLSLVASGGLAGMLWLVGLLTLVCQNFAFGFLDFTDMRVVDPILTLFWLTLFFVILPAFFTTLILFGLAHLVTTSLGQQVQRQALWDMDQSPQRWGYLALVGPSLVFALGFAFGFFLLPLDVLRPNSQIVSLFTIFWLSGLVFLVWIWMVYLRFVTRFCLGTKTGFDRPTVLAWLLRSAATVVFCLFFWPIGLGLVGLTVYNNLPNPFVANIIEFAMRIPNWNEYVIAGMAVIYPVALFVFTVFFYLGWVCISIFFIWLANHFRNRYCGVCGEGIAYRFAVGRSCPGCDSVLAPWLYLKPGVSKARGSL